MLNTSPQVRCGTTTSNLEQHLAKADFGNDLYIYQQVHKHECILQEPHVMYRY